MKKFRNRCSAGGRTRTDTELPPRDFESLASTSFTTPASTGNAGIICKRLWHVKEGNRSCYVNVLSTELPLTAVSDAGLIISCVLCRMLQFLCVSYYIY